MFGGAMFGRGVEFKFFSTLVDLNVMILCGVGLVKFIWKDGGMGQGVQCELKNFSMNKFYNYRLGWEREHNKDYNGLSSLLALQWVPIQKDICSP